MIVQLTHVSAASANGLSVTTAAIDTTGADLLVLVLADQAAGTVVSDSKGNTWNALTTQVSEASRCTILWSKPTTVGTGHTFTAANASNAGPSLSVGAFSGTAASPFDQQNGAASSGGAGVTSLATGSITPSANGALLVVGIANNQTGFKTTPGSVGSGFAILDSVAGDVGAHAIMCGLATLIQTTATAINPTVTEGGGTYSGVAIASFKSASVPAVLAAASSVGLATVAALTATATFAAVSGVALATVATLTANGPLRASSTIGISTAASLRTTPTLSAASSFSFSTSANMVVPLRATSGIRFSSAASLHTGTEALHATTVSITLDGVDVSGASSASRTRLTPLAIHDVINDAPNTCDLTFQGDPPSGSQRLRVTLNLDEPRLLFDGTLQRRDTTYAGTPDNLLLGYPCSAIDGGAQANRRRPFGTWVDVSASTIATYITSVFAPGFTSAHVQPDLEPVSIIFDGNDTFMGCLARLAKLIGGYCFVEDLDVALFTDADVIGLELPLDIDESGGRFLDDPQIHISIDDSQLQTRVYGKGHAESVLADLLAGETIIPIADAVMFGTISAGGLAITGTTPDGAQSQRLAYTGVQRGGAGSLVGPSVQPSVGPTLIQGAGAGLTPGIYGGAYTFVTAAGESVPSPVTYVTVGVAVANPASAPTIQNSSSSHGSYGASWNIGDSLYLVVTYLNAAGETLGSAVSNTIVAVQSIGSFPEDVDVTSVPISSDPSVTTKRLYLNRNGTWFGSWTMPNSSPNRYNLQQAGGLQTFGLTPPVSNTTAGFQVAVAGIGLGPTGTTARKYYRTAVNGSQLKLQQTIANNTATVGVQDATADGSLGANAPTGDTSGLSTVAGQVNAGSTSLLTASAGPFQGGGWTTNGIRYTGISGNTLTGIPATGPGAILNTLKYGEHIDPAPALTGVTGLTLALLKGTPVSIWVQRDDLAAQAEQAAIDLSAGRTPADGVYEGPIVVDARRGEASLIDLCDVTLQLYSRPIITITYDTRDVKTKSGRPVHFDLPSFGLAPITLTIQSVDITEIDFAPGTSPRFHVVASTVRHSLDDLLRTLIAAKQAA